MLCATRELVEKAPWYKRDTWSESTSRDLTRPRTIKRLKKKLKPRIILLSRKYNRQWYRTLKKMMIRCLATICMLLISLVVSPCEYPYLTYSYRSPTRPCGFVLVIDLGICLKVRNLVWILSITCNINGDTNPSIMIGVIEIIVKYNLPQTA